MIAIAALKNDRRGLSYRGFDRGIQKNPDQAILTVLPDSVVGGRR
jgi:hypothetical protein